MSEKKTPLYDRHIELSGNVINFGGFLLPTQYAGIKQEHNAVRSKAGLFDVSHMGEFIVSGHDAEKFLQKVTVNDVASLSVGQAQYSAMCYDNGGIVDDLLVYKKDSEYMLVVNAANLVKDFDWLQSHVEGDVNIENKSDDIGLVALQGPRSRDILQTLTDKKLSNIQFYHFSEGKVSGKECITARTGYTGELGFEIYADADEILEIWDAIMDAGSDKGLEPAGLGSRDTLRIEMKYALYGNDIDETTNPIEAGLSWIVKFKKDFIGKDFLLKYKSSKNQKRLIGFRMLDKAIPRKGYSVLFDNKSIGIVTSGTHSPNLSKGIGLAYIDNQYNKIGNMINIEIRNRLMKAEIVKTPFVQNTSIHS